MKAQGYSSTLSLTLELGGGRWSKPRPGCLCPRKETWYQFYRRLGGYLGRSGRVRKTCLHRDSTSKLLIYPFLLIL